jgi:putative PIN family toxin of toxin-antitoxin system
MLIVLDTNVLVSGLLNPHGAPGRIVDLVVASEVQLAFDDRILSEYSEVLQRSKFGFPPRRIEAILDFFQLAGTHVSAPPLAAENVPDRDDLPFAEVAVAVEAAVLVTGNQNHFDFIKDTKVAVLSPREFVDQWPNPST